MKSLKTVLKTAALASVAFAPLAATAGEEVSPQRAKISAGNAAGAAAGQTAGEKGGLFGLGTAGTVGAVGIAALVAIAVESMTDGDKDAGTDPIPGDDTPAATTTTTTTTTTATTTTTN